MTTPLLRRAPLVAPTALAVYAALACSALAPSAAHAQVELCEGAERFVREVVGMAAVAEPDTIDDWRTRKMVPGCRVTAAGALRGSGAAEVRTFYERLRDAGWVRTPEPRDAPNEASMRFRRDGADCLFNYYDATTTLGTEAELVVSDAVPLRPGETLFNFLVMCTPEAPAAPRG
jgi:hypothetical protein